MSNFEGDHGLAWGEGHPLHPHGDPDNVDGWYTKRLSYKEWYQLACAKRAHQEQVETTPVATVFTLLGALRYPGITLGVGVLYLLGMAVFARSYQASGANTGAKCLGRIVTKWSLWTLGGLALVSTALIVRDSKCLEDFIEKARGLFH